MENINIYNVKSWKFETAQRKISCIPSALSFGVDSYLGSPQCSQFFLSTFQRLFATSIWIWLPSRRIQVHLHIPQRVGATEIAPKWVSHFFNQDINTFISWRSGTRVPRQIVQEITQYFDRWPTMFKWNHDFWWSGLLLIAVSKQGLRWSRRSAGTCIKPFLCSVLGSWERKYLTK